MIKNFLKYSQKGASLIELILYFALLGIILTVVVDIIIRTSEFSLASSAKASLQQDGAFLINRLSFDIHRAETLDNLLNPGDSSTSTLVLTSSSNTYTYTHTGTDLELQETGATTRTTLVNSTRVTVNSISFEHVGNTNGKPTVKITFEIESATKVKGGSVKQTFETVVGLR